VSASGSSDIILIYREGFGWLPLKTRHPFS